MPTKSPRDRLPGDRSGHTPDAESRAAPTIPSFASLRTGRRRSPVDLLLPQTEPAARVSPDTDRAAPRPPDYVDLLRLGVHVVRTLAGVPVRVTVWSVREPVRRLRRLGRRRGPVPG